MTPKVLTFLSSQKEWPPLEGKKKLVNEHSLLLLLLLLLALCVCSSALTTKISQIIKVFKQVQEIKPKKLNTGSLSLILGGIRNQHHHHPFLASNQDPKETHRKVHKRKQNK